LRPRDPHAPRLKRLEVLSLALRQTLESSDFDQAQSLLNERDLLIAELETAPLTPQDRERLQIQMQHEATLVQTLKAAQTTLLSSLYQLQHQRQANDAYREPETPTRTRAA